MDHVWPPELDSDARCERCGLLYNQWSMDELDCVLPGAEPKLAPGLTWNIEPAMSNVVFITFDDGAEWAETHAFGPFTTLGDAEEFCRQMERAYSEENPTVWTGYLRSVSRAT